MAHNRLREFLQTRFHNFPTFTYKATQILHKYSNNSEKKAFWTCSLGLFTAKKRIFINRGQRRFVTASLSGSGTLVISIPPRPLPHLWRKKRQSDKGQKQPEVLLSILDIVAHPHHQGLKNGFLIWDVDVITGEQLNYLCSGEQQELLVLNDLQEVFLTHRRGHGKGSHRLSAKGTKTRTERVQKSTPVERSDAETLFQLFQWQCHLFSFSQVNKTIHSSGYKSIWRLKQETWSLFSGLQGLKTADHHGSRVITSFF